ncbi:MAG TPA: 3-methyladenine DNA glycosylase [Cryptosporangiaceae bacterium]|nr:3-methyladenine DNA glycosylase [Cryptosporangiaceae bacterium]
MADDLQVLAEPEWQTRRAAHERRVDALLTGPLARRRRGEKHPVEDFLFEYYSYRPAHLRRWHPGPGVVLTGSTAEPYLALFGYTTVDAGVTLDLDAVLERRADTLRWVADLLAATASRPAQLGCFGMHEWAMVYRDPRLRHPSWPLRLGAEGTAAVVDDRGVRCSHFDAFRFFTEPARPLNVVQPRRDTQVALEQPGCLHATMDLYKWAYKLAPLTPSSLVLDCFELARDTRELDMRASPYDLSALGYPPVRVETSDGRAEYAAAQRTLTDRGAALRGRLLDLCRAVSPGPSRP